MYLRVSTVRRGAKTYRYAQLVESFRRPDGKPTNRVIASLGAMDDIAIENLRAALKGGREGEALVLPSSVTGTRDRVRVRENLQYANVAALLRLWNELGLGRLIAEVTCRDDDQVAIEHVVAALVLQRCVAPGSKLAAERWYPTTALPELQGVAPGRFNNSRIHRALEALDGATAELQRRIAPLVVRKEGDLTTLFIDATDTWFVGNGPPLAEKGLDKEGVFRRRVGIVLLCDQRGFPLRWHTLSGRYHDPTALAEMAKEAASLPWARGVPVVMDRAAGNARTVDALDKLALLYVTALPAPEFESCGAPIPWETLDAMQSETGDDAVTRLGECAAAAGFIRVRDTRYVLDLGVFDKARPATAGRTSQAAYALQLIETEEGSPGVSHATIAERASISARTLRRYLGLRRLGPEVRRRIRAGEADGLDVQQLCEIARQPAEAQSKRLDAILEQSPPRRRRVMRKHDPELLTHRARAVLSFNPHRFVEDRRSDTQNLAQVENRIAEINRRLAHASSRRSDASALAEVDQLLGKYGLRNVATPLMERVGDVRCVVLEKDERAWARRRRGHGINLIVAQPDVPGTAQELVQRYFAKDAIEKDFQTIKSFVELRPVHHRTDPKLRAHVDICMLALLLNRVLSTRLEGTDVSARAALELLDRVRLNLVDGGGAPYYTVTEPNDDVAAVLRTLQMLDLTDDDAACEAITPR